MHLTFLGTCAGAPSLHRNVTSIALTFSPKGETWLFDCGEATQHQFMRTALKPGRLEKIFITHLHGDHIFGLPGLLTSRSMSSIVTPLTIYGPKGLKTFIDTALQISGSWVDFPLTIVEVEPGIVDENDEFRVIAQPLDHAITCFGYRVEQKDLPGRLDQDLLKADDIPAGVWLQHLKRGKDVRLPDGRELSAQRYLGPGKKGKVVTLLGDTAPCENAILLAQDADILVHEATLEAAMAEKANGRGHSTTAQAAEIAQRAQVKKLIATHFSSRYRHHDMPRLLAECRAVFTNTEFAEDFMVVEI
ncbi:ribonuclease Z [Rosenbergiella collisarenosi]|uniref:ribonuclease Z n=1 Tax=Rosenbergiella collisarenosi TaxID=1544695 RepID=UPI001BD9E897|nr:ribonuclease Z [Rosenbergiella collisarenosi]MBT0721988.1 ribonuclease Z [Rosenbergiella collisarenosi]